MRAEPGSENLATFYGNSIGKWEGDTLVIDSIVIRRCDVVRTRRLFTPAACISSKSSHALVTEIRVRNDDRRPGGAR